MAGNSNQNQPDATDDAELGEAGSGALAILTNAKVRRFIAVILFVILGSVAVVFSMRGNPADDHADHDHGSETATTADGKPADQLQTAGAESANPNTSPESLPAAPNSAPADGVEPAFHNVSTVGLSLMGKAGQQGNTPSFDPSTSSSGSPAVALDPQVRPSAAIGGLGSNPAQQKNGFAGDDKPTTTPNGFQAQNLVPKRPPEENKPAVGAAEPPAERFAQLPEGRPLLGSRNGFGQRQRSAAENSGERKKPFAAPDFSNNASDSNESENELTATPPRADLPPHVNELRMPAGSGLDPASSDATNNAPTSNPPNANAFGNPNPAVGNPSNESPFSQPTGPPRSNSPFSAPPVNPAPPADRSVEQENRTTPASPFDTLRVDNQFGSRAETPKLAPPPSTSPFARPSGTAGSDLGNQSNPAIGGPPVAPNSLVRSKAPFNTPEPPPATEPARPNQIPARPASNIRSISEYGVGTIPAPLAAVNATMAVPGGRELEGVQASSITIEKLSPPEVQVNQPAEFQIVVKNIGRVAVDDVQVFDQVPTGTEYQSATPEPNANTNQKLSWQLGSMAPGTEKRILLKLNPTRPGEIGSVAQVTFASRSSMRAKVTQPVLEISHRTQPSVLIGNDVIFDVLVSNKGDGPARNVLIQEDVPVELSFQNGYRELEYEVGTLLPGQSKNIRLALKAKQAGKLRNLMFVSAAGGLKSKHEVDLEVVAPTLVAKAEGPTRKFLGREAVHNFSVANSGTAPATNVEMIARLPQGVRFISTNHQGTYDPGSHSVFWSLAKLDPGSSAGVELKTNPVAIGNHPIQFESVADLDLRDKTEQAFSIEHLVDVFFDIDDMLDPVEIGNDTQYQVEIVNQGTKVAANVRIQVDFPVGIEPKSVSGPLAHNITGQQILFQPIAALKPGEKLNLVITATGRAAGDHRVAIQLQSDGRTTPVSKEESTRVYDDR